MPLVTFDDRNVSSGKTVLFSGGTYNSRTVTLSDSSANYDILHIYFINNDNVITSQSVYNPNGKNVTAWANTTANGDGSYVKTATFSISGATITSRTSQYQHYMRSSLITTSAVNNVGVYAVIGEKLS